MNPYRDIDGSVGSPKKFFVGLVMTPDGMYYPVHKEMNAGFIPPKWTARCVYEASSGLEKAITYTWVEGEEVSDDADVLKVFNKNIKHLFYL